MGWTDPPRRYFLAAGQAAQFSFAFPSAVPGIFSWQGPQLAVAKADPDDVARGISLVLVTQWQGTRVSVDQHGRKSYSYLLGIQNGSSSGVWFHLEGGKLA
jgi:hypothetical protein